MISKEQVQKTKPREGRDDHNGLLGGGGARDAQPHKGHQNTTTSKHSAASRRSLDAVNYFWAVIWIAKMMTKFALEDERDICCGDKSHCNEN